MNNSIKLALIATVAAIAASAQAASYTFGDLIIGFTSGTGNDYIYDLGQFSAVTGSGSQTWSVGTGFSGDFGVVGVSQFASGASQHFYVTSSDVNQNGFIQANGLARANIQTIAGGSSAIQAGQSRTPLATDTTGWYMQTDQPAGTPGNTFFNNYYNPNTAVGSVAYLFDNVNGGGTQVGTLNYDGITGNLSFTPVPEPSSYSLLGGAGFLMVWLRRRSLPKS